MRKFISNTALVAIASSGMLFASCSDHDMFNPNYKADEYAANWEQKIGKVDPNQDWSMATKVTAKANVANIPGNSILKIYNYSPLAPESRVLGVTNLSNGVGEVAFDALKGATSLFVTIEQNGEYKLYGGYNVEDGQLSIGNVAKAKTRAAGTCPVGKGDLVDFIDKTIPAVTHKETQIVETPIQYTVYRTDWGVNGEWYNSIDELGKAIWAALDSKGQTWHHNNPEWIGTLENGVWTNINGVQTRGGSKEEKEIEVVDVPEQKIDINLQYLTNVETTAAEPWKQGWGYQMFGTGSFFQEQKKYYLDPKYPNLYDAETLAQIEKGFSIKTKGGEITLPFIYGATQIVDQFGYVFYKDGEDPLTQPHYILMEYGRPQDNIYWDNWKGTAVGEMQLSVWSNFENIANAKNNPINCYCNHDEWGNNTGIYGPAGKHLESCYIPEEKYIEAYNKPVYGTEYKLVYFDESGNATYNIPAGLNVVFFVCPVNNIESRDYVKSNFNYSLPELNKRIDHLYSNTNSPTFEEGNNTVGHAKARGAVKAASWTFKGHKFLGFEDGGNDEDLNDIVFWVEGNFEDEDKPIVIPDPDPEPTPEPTPTPETQSWILACEDLGDTDDYDFNDIVLEIQKVDEVNATGENHKVQVRCLAAGGTLPAHIYYKDKEIGESHALLGGQTSQMINTYSFGKASDWITIEENVDKDWTLVARDFSIEVGQKDDNMGSVIITAPQAGTAPQMIVVPGDWEWPSERTKIQEAYPNFANWNGNASFTGWNETKVSNLVIKH